MAYKRYIKIGNKLYGPYEYHSYRGKDGSVKSRYLRKIEKVEEENVNLKRRLNFHKVGVLALMILVVLMFIFYITSFHITGKIILDLDSTYTINEALRGYLNMEFSRGEFYPADSKVIIHFDNYTQELTLDEIVEVSGAGLEQREETFYTITGKLDGQGSGPGYGFLGSKDIPVDIYFELVVLKQLAEKNLTEEPVENITEEEGMDEIEEPLPETPPEIPLEEQPSEASPEQPAEEQPPEEKPQCDVVLTGAVVEEVRRVFGKCDIKNPFIYNLESDELAELVPGSVRTENETLPDSAVNVVNEGRKARVTTDHALKEYGYGPDYIGEEEYIRINLEQFNFTVNKEGEYTLSVEFVYQNITLASVSAEVVFENVTESITNVTNTTNLTHAPLLLKEIPDIVILKNTNYSFDLSEYFTDPDNGSLEFSADEMVDISTILEESIATIVPEKDFVGTRHTRFYASDGENETESNLVKIEVREPGNFSIAVVDKEGAVLDSMLLNTTKVKVDISKVIVEGNEEFRLNANVLETENEESEIEENITQEPISEENSSIETETAPGENFSITGLAVKNKLGKIKGKVNGTMNEEIEPLYTSTINFISWKDSVTIQIDKPTQKHISEGIATEIFAIEPSNEIKIESATITLAKLNDTNIEKIVKCNDWNIDEFDCNGQWQETGLNFEQDNETLTFNVSEFSAYAGASTTNETIKITLLSHTEQCLVNCESILNIYVPENFVKEKTEKIKLDKTKASKLVEEKELELEEKDVKKKNKEKRLKVNQEHWLDTNLIDLWFLETEESRLENFVLEKAVNVTKEKLVYDYEPCGESPTTQGAKKLCVKGSHIEKYNVTEWRPLVGAGLDAGNNLVRISGIKKAKLGENNIDWKISLNVSEIAPGAMYIEPELAWWNSSWGRRVPISVWGPNGGSPENYSIPMNISYDSDMRNDFDDLRFVDDDNVTELDYWIQEKSNGEWAIVWVEIKDAISDSENQTIYMYYGNSIATSKSNISTTFLFGDDFNDGSIAPEWMNNTGPIYEANGVIFMNASSYTDVAKLYINTTGGIIYDFAVMAKVRPDYLDSGDYRLGIAMKHEWDGMGDGYNLLIKDDNTSAVVFLDDWNAWGNEAYPGFSYSEGNWYWFEMATIMGLWWDNLLGRSWQVGSERPDWQVTQQWSTRSGATAGLNLGYLSYGSFDDFVLRKYTSNEPFAYAINTTQETANLVVNASSPACIAGEAYYSTIQAAINAASNGSVITVCPGTYTENVKVNKTVTIDGYSATISDTIVKAITTGNDAFEVTKNSSVIKDLTVKDSRYGIYLNGNVYYTTISNVNFSGNARAIYLYNNCRNNTINNVNITTTASNAYGVYIDSNSHFNSLANANILLTGSSSHAIALTSSSNNTINGNNATTYSTSSCGVSLHYSSNNNIVNNSIKTNGSNSHGIYLYNGCSRNVINLNTVNVTGSGSNGISGYYGASDRNNITNNIVQKAEKGIYLSGFRNTLIKNNSVLNANTGSNSYGIYLSQCENNTLQDNQVNNSRYGIYIVGGNKWNFNHSIDTSNLVNGYPIYYFNNYASNIDCSILNQNALSNTNVTAGDIGKITVANSQNIIVENCNISNENQLGNAVAVLYSNNVTVRNSNASNNQWAVYLESSNNSNISNIVSSGYKGIQIFSYSMNNTVENSRINTSASDGYGVYVYSYSNGTTIKNNEIRASSTSGIYLNRYSMNNNLIQNNITLPHGNAYAIDIVDSSHNGNLSGNIINTSCFGIRLNKVNNYTMNFNTINIGSCGVNNYGFYIVGNNDNIINNSVVISTISGYTRGVYFGNGVSRNLINNNTIYIVREGSYGIEITGGTNDKNNLTNNNLSVLGMDSRGIYFGSTTTNSTVSGNIINTNRSNANSWAFYSDSVNNVRNTFVGNIFKGDDLSTDVNVSFTHSGSVALKVIPNASRPANPGSYQNINKYINATNLSANAWLYLNISYNDSDVVVVDENTLFMARHNGTWEINTSKFASSFGVNTTVNYVYANITNFSVFAPLGNLKTGCIGEHYIFRCGDKINESCTMNANLNADGTCLIIDSDNVVIDCNSYTINYSAAESGYGIVADGFDNITIKNCKIQQSNSSIQGFNIFLNNSDNSIIENNNLTRGKGGILAMNSFNATIRNNYGSYFEYGESTQWDVCMPFNNTEPYKYYESAIWLVDSNNATIFNNTIQGNMSEAGMTNHNGTEAGITLCRSNYSNISINTIKATDTYGIFLQNNSNHAKILYNFVNGSSASGFTNTNDGIILAASHNNNVSFNELYSCNEWGIFLANANNNTIHNNTASYNGVGIRIGGTSSYNEVYDNIVENNDESGILINGNYNIVRNNILNYNFKGLSFMDNQEGYCHDNIVHGTAINNSDYGVYVDLNYATGCTNNLVFDSSITNTINKDVEVVALEGSQNFNLTFLNVSFDKSSVYISNDVESGELYVKWYLDAFVKWSNGTAVNNATVSAWDRYGVLTFTKLTGQGLPNYKARGWTDMSGNILLYHMDEASGTIVDYSGEGNNGTNNGATYGASGKFNTALGFDGDDYVEVSYSSVFNVSNITVEAWVKPAIVDNNFHGIIVSGGQWGGYSQGWRWLQHDSNGHLIVQMNFGDPTPQGITIYNVFTPGNWHHIAMTYDHSYLRVYVNGIERGNLSENRNINTATESIWIGNAQWFFNGTIDEVAIYNRALSATEIAQHYNASGYIERQNVTEYFENATGKKFYYTNYSMKAVKNPQSPIEK
ncbi:MAG: DUF2341 domain-containing protein, partial [Candidatus Bathyarchaeota archaeon]|nr:DUF2341 domain-containing protein [Candidatus Bathyarchaeota archaeon]